jgi:choline dehydrogenase-like flavoprotein
VGRYFSEPPGRSYRGRVPGLTWNKKLSGRVHQFYEVLKREGLGGTILRVRRSRKFADVLEISGGIEIGPAASNRLSLDPDTEDRFGNPGARLHLDFGETDLKTWERVDQLIRTIYADLAATDVEEDGSLSWSHHHVSSCRAGTDPRHSVTDANLRVHESANLYVAGSAVFATSGGGGHPTLGLVALSHRLADHLTGVLKA